MSKAAKVITKLVEISECLSNEIDNLNDENDLLFNKIKDYESGKQYQKVIEKDEEIAIELATKAIIKINEKYVNQEQRKCNRKIT